MKVLKAILGTISLLAAIAVLTVTVPIMISMVCLMGTGYFIYLIIRASLEDDEY